FEMGELLLPAVILLNGAHYVVLDKFENGIAKVRDPGMGIRYLDKVNLTAEFSGHILEFSPQHLTPERISPSETEINIWNIFKDVKNIRLTIINVVILGIVYQALQALIPILMQHVIDGVISSNNVASIVQLIWGFILLCVAQFVFGAGRAAYIANASARIRSKVNVSTFSHLMNLPVDYFSSRTIGSIH